MKTHNIKRWMNVLPTSVLCKVFKELTICDLCTLTRVDHHTRTAAVQVFYTHKSPTTHSNLPPRLFAQVLSSIETCNIFVRLDLEEKLHVMRTLLCHCTSLRRLHITSQALMPLPCFPPTLRHLKLLYAQDVSWAAIHMRCPSLTHLWLEHSIITDDGIKCNHRIPLRHLELFYCHVANHSFDDMVSLTADIGTHLTSHMPTA